MMKYCLFVFVLFTFNYSFALQECGSWSEDWFLREININDNSIYLSPNEEVVNVTLQCPFSSTGDFIATFCATGEGIIEQNGNTFSFINQEFLISGDYCNEMPNNEIEDLYFSFFTSNIEEVFVMEQWHIWGVPPPEPEEIGFLQIFAPNGDYLLFEDYPLSLLAIDEYSKQITQIIPNPIGDKFQLKIAPSYQLNSLSLYNQLGDEIEKLDILNLDNLQVDHLSSGLYFLRMVNDKGDNIYKKIIKK